MMNELLTIRCSIDFDKIMNGSSGELLIGETIYKICRLDKNIRANKGGNSWVMKMYQTSDDEDESFDNNPISIIKVNKAEYYNEGGKYDRKKNKRINQEIDALQECKNKKAKYVISIDFDGILLNNNRDVHRFYTMEVAECDLKQYMERNDLDFLERIETCMELTKSLRELWKLGFYHRDIKPDNFFHLETGEWKVGDLGLVAKRNTSETHDGENEFIGPKGWTSPETMNKYLVEESNDRFDRIIDEKSDMFQLGMVFWYIMQGNAPIGCIMEKDFLNENHDLYQLIRSMVSHSKLLRPMNFDIILERLNQIANRCLY
ncbi:MAG: protein kinase family protein [Bacteroidales bacterium]|nr:protein kinase family protein [Bacteroidales bacterium]